ncbi:enoyl-CoA hydratase/isomerase family protein [Streptomyces sp. NPDC001220]
MVGQPEVGIGTFPGAGAVQQLVPLTGRAQAMQVILGSEDIGAREAERTGVANQAVPNEELISYVERLAERIATFPEAAARLAKRRINAAGLPLKEDVQGNAGFLQIPLCGPSSAAWIGTLVQRGMQERSCTELVLGEAVSQL